MSRVVPRALSPPDTRGAICGTGRVILRTAGGRIKAHSCWVGERRHAGNNYRSYRIRRERRAPYGAIIDFVAIKARK